MMCKFYPCKMNCDEKIKESRFSPQDELFAWRSSEFGFSQSSAPQQHSGGKAFRYVWDIL